MADKRGWCRALWADPLLCDRLVMPQSSERGNQLCSLHHYRWAASCRLSSFSQQHFHLFKNTTFTLTEKKQNLEALTSQNSPWSQVNAERESSCYLHVSGCEVNDSLELPAQLPDDGQADALVAARYHSNPGRHVCPQRDISVWDVLCGAEWPEISETFTGVVLTMESWEQLFVISRICE